MEDLLSKSNRSLKNELSAKKKKTVHRFFKLLAGQAMKVREIWIWIGNPDLDSGRPKSAPKRKKMKKFHVLNSLNGL